jgi:ribosomal protein L37AE/L43A
MDDPQDQEAMPCPRCKGLCEDRGDSNGQRLWHCAWCEKTYSFTLKARYTMSTSTAALFTTVVAMLPGERAEDWVDL